MKKRDDVFIAEMLQRIRAVKDHLNKVTQDKFMKSELHKSAVVRELEVLGEAAKQVSENIKKNYSELPWNQMIGMRNRLIHEYFDVDDSIVWEVAKIHLPGLEKDLEKIFLNEAAPIHPWRNCPSGYYYVQEHDRKTSPSKKNPTGLTSVKAHCRKNPTGLDQLYRDEIVVISNTKGKELKGMTIGKLSEPSNANSFDELISIWTQYWNDIFSEKDPLSADYVKALFFSESSFRLNVKDQKIGKSNFARGPMQISDQTRKVLGNEKGELKNHYLTLTAQDVRNPKVALSAAVRWLFHKKEDAGKYLKREASWDEAVAHYKGYLRSKKDFREQKGMKVFFETLKKLEGKGDKK
jgi:uncharacterized protein with HEPN domain